MRYLFLALVISLVTVSCSKNDKNKDLPAVSYTNVNYGTGTSQNMDVYLPENRNDQTPLLIIIHGGGWTAGDKSDYTAYISEFQRRLPNYAFANLNYRLASSAGNFFPTQENDIKDAVQFLINNAGEYNISKKFVILGLSAGAHLGLLQGYKHTDIVKPIGLISYFGPTDLVRLYENSGSGIPTVLKTITNTALEENPAILTESSPINYVNANSAPTLILHGDADTLVPLEQATMLKDKLQSLGVKYEIEIYPGQGHDMWTQTALFDSFNKVENFIKDLQK